MRTIRLLVVTFAALAMLGGLGAGVAGAQEGAEDYPLGEVLPDSLVNEETPAAENSVTPLAQQQPAVRARTASLPVTGGDLVGLAVIGAGALAVGTVLVRSRRTN